MSGVGLHYIPRLIAAYRAGHASDHVHLGYWPPGASYDWLKAQDAMTHLHLNALELRNGQTIVDIGCGLGGSLRLADARVDEATLIGVNIDRRQLEICQSQQPDSANTFEWIEADAGMVPLPSECADGLLSLEAMFHFPSRRAFLAEAARIMRPGALMICSDILFDAPQSACSREWLTVVSEGFAPWPEPVIDRNVVLDAAVHVGLKVTGVREISTSVAPSWKCIGNPRDDPRRSPVPAMRALQEVGLLHYILFALEKK